MSKNLLNNATPHAEPSDWVNRGNPVGLVIWWQVIPPTGDVGNPWTDRFRDSSLQNLLVRLRFRTVNCCGEPGFLEAAFDGNERSGQAAPTTAGRSGTWITVIANGRVEESVPTFDFMVRQNFGEPQLNESSHYKHWREVRDSRRYQTTRVPKLVCHAGVLSIQDYSRGRSIAT